MKQQAIKELRQAKRAHKQWISYAQGILNGVHLNTQQLKIDETECVFGCWWFSNGQKLKSLPYFSDIEDLHTLVHDVCREILGILLSERKMSFTDKWIKQKDVSLSDADTKRLKQKSSQLLDVSHALLETIEQLENLIIRMDNEIFEGYYAM